MTWAGDTVGDGFLPATKGTLYTVPDASTFYCKSIVCVNKGATTETVILYIKRSPTSRVWCRGVLEPNERLVADPFALGATRLIEGETTNASTVEYLITGVLKT